MSKLREAAARFITEAGFSIYPEDIECVSGYWLRVDCYRFEVYRNGRHIGCWLSLTQFVKECRQYGGAEITDGEVYPKYPKKVEAPEPPLPDYEF